MAGFYPDKGRWKTPETLLSEANRFAPNERRSVRHRHRCGIEHQREPSPLAADAFGAERDILDRRMIEQMLVSVALERQGELRRTQKLIDLLGRRDTVAGGTHTLTLLMGKP